MLHNSLVAPTFSKATIFLFLGLRISWPEKRVGRSEKNLQNHDIGPIMSSCRKSYMEIVIKSVKGNYIILVHTLS